jgi:diguanylate cyclase (GGDEF)-like protein
MLRTRFAQDVVVKVGVEVVDGGRYMSVTPEASDEHHFGGTYMRALIRHLRATIGPDRLNELLAEVGEDRSQEILTDDATWSSFDRFRDLLQATGRALGGPDVLRAVGRRLYDLEDFDLNPSVQALGSPEALYANAAAAVAMVCPIVRWTATQVAIRDWTIEQRLGEGFEPFEELCSVQAGIMEISTVIFGYPLAAVVEEQCACRGAPACVFRIRWEPADEVARQAEFLEERVRALEGRLEQFERTVGDLVSGEDLQTVLARTFVAASRSVRAPICVLALSDLPEGVQRVYSSGVSVAGSEVIAAGLLAGTEADEDLRLVAEVASTRRRYGRLAAIRPTGGFLPQERSRLQAYASLLAAALDSGGALAEAHLHEAEARRQELEARRQGDTARALLELSTALAEVTSVEEMAAKLVRAVPAVMGCDGAAVLLPDADGTQAWIVATHGFSASVDRLLKSHPVPIVDRRAGQTEFERYSDTAAGSLSQTMMGAAGASARMVIPIFVDGQWAGAIDASVAGDPDRLRPNHDAQERLRGLAAQAATAIRNAHLLDRVRHEALHDPLTGLPNRALILDRAEQMLARARRNQQPAAAMFIDLDGFKEINDTFGHAAGDELLRAVTARLDAVLRPTDTVGRLGGDEFVVLVDGVSMDAGPELVAERLLAALREPFQIADHHAGRLSITASIGIATGDRTSAGELLRDADVALYQAKAAGKNRFLVFEAQMQTTVHDRLLLQMDLQNALAGEQLTLEYQPICNLSTGEMTGVEALLQWQHPSRGQIPPDDFSALLEESGLILEVGRWVLQGACGQATDWHARGICVDMVVSISGRQLHDDRFLTDLGEVLTSTGIDPASLVLEIAESVFMSDVRAFAARLKAVRALGVRVAIDDFGTGYSSLSALRDFPVDVLKIDRAFVSGIGSSIESTALIQTLIHLGKTLGFSTLAEGINDPMQYARAPGTTVQVASIS